MFADEIKSLKDITVLGNRNQTPTEIENLLKDPLTVILSYLPLPDFIHLAASSFTLFERLNSRHNLWVRLALLSSAEQYALLLRFITQLTTQPNSIKPETFPAYIAGLKRYQHYLEQLPLTEKPFERKFLLIALLLIFQIKTTSILFCNNPELIQLVQQFQELANWQSLIDKTLVKTLRDCIYLAAGIPLEPLTWEDIRIYHVENFAHGEAIWKLYLQIQGIPKAIFSQALLYFQGVETKRLPVANPFLHILPKLQKPEHLLLYNSIWDLAKQSAKTNSLYPQQATLWVRLFTQIIPFPSGKPKTTEISFATHGVSDFFKHNPQQRSYFYNLRARIILFLLHEQLKSANRTAETIDLLSVFQQVLFIIGSEFEPDPEIFMLLKSCFKQLTLLEKQKIISDFLALDSCEFENLTEAFFKDIVLFFCHEIPLPNHETLDIPAIKWLALVSPKQLSTAQMTILIKSLQNPEHFFSSAYVLSKVLTLLSSLDDEPETLLIRQLSPPIFPTNKQQTIALLFMALAKIMRLPKSFSALVAFTELHPELRSRILPALADNEIYTKALSSDFLAIQTQIQSQLTACPLTVFNWQAWLFFKNTFKTLFENNDAETQAFFDRLLYIAPKIRLLHIIYDDKKAITLPPWQAILLQNALTMAARHSIMPNSFYQDCLLLLLKLKTDEIIFDHLPEFFCNAALRITTANIDYFIAAATKFGIKFSRLEQNTALNIDKVNHLFSDPLIIIQNCTTLAEAHSFLKTYCSKCTLDQLKALSLSLAQSKPEHFTHLQTFFRRPSKEFDQIINDAIALKATTKHPKLL